MLRLVCGLTLILLLASTATVAFADDFSVGTIPGLQWWADAQAGHLFKNPDGTGGVGNGDPVGFITDLSGHGHNGVMGNAIVSGGDAFRPIFQAGATHGRGGLLFDGVNDYSDLQGDLINGATELTLAFAIDCAGVFQGNRRMWAASDGTNVGQFGISAANGPTLAFAVGQGQFARAADSSGLALKHAMDQDTTVVIISRFKSDGSLDLWVNGVQRDAQSLPANVDRVIRTTQSKFLGNQNGASTPTGKLPLSGDYSNFYFLEGLAATSAISDAQVGQLDRYLERRWPGARAIDSSPNIYWDSTTNGSRTVPVQNSGHAQGVAAGGSNRFAFHTSLIEKYDANWNQIGHNQDVFAGIPAIYGPLDHLGDGDYYGGKLFVPVESGLGGGGQFIGVYDATAPGLPLIAARDITAQHHEVSSMVVVPQHGAHGIIYATSFEPDHGADKLWMYDLQGGDTNAIGFGGFLGSLAIPSTIAGIQGVAWHAPYFYFSAADAPTGGNRIERVRFLNGQLDDHSEVVLRGATTLQGLAFDGDLALQAFQWGGSKEYVGTFRNFDFAPLEVPEPGGFALLATGGLAALLFCRAGAQGTRDLTQVPASVSRRPLDLALKRAFDLIGAGCGLILLSPIFLLAAIAVRLSSPGPILFRQRRVGRDFKPFDILKFRTMVAEAPQRGASITVGADPRITGVGRLLRRFKIDELPQLVNVWRGDMSLVGPRPEVPQYVEMFADDFRQILQIRPGITDPASLKFRHEADLLGTAADPTAEYVQRILPEKLALAKKYVAERSLRYDFWLIVRTLFRVIEP